MSEMSTRSLSNQRAAAIASTIVSPPQALYNDEGPLREPSKLKGNVESALIQPKSWVPNNSTKSNPLGQTACYPQSPLLWTENWEAESMPVTGAWVAAAAAVAAAADAAAVVVAAVALLQLVRAATKS